MRLPFCLAILILPATAFPSSTTIYDVVNYGSRIGSGLPGAGIAQGALFAVTGSSLGPDQALQGKFPLPLTDGLGGVTITIQASTTTVSAIMVSVSANEVDAILPSSTPLGPATVMLSYAGATAAMPITVVAAAFGIFGAAGVYNLTPDGTATLNTLYLSARTGQTVLISGTGLGAIASDETMSGATDAASAEIKVWVGSTQAVVVSAGRGWCCGEINPRFPIPRGIAAWDVIAFQVPDDAAGCSVSIVVQTATSVSNFKSFSVTQGAGTCLEEAQAGGGDAIEVSGAVKVATINMQHSETTQTYGDFIGPPNIVGVKSVLSLASASFYRFDAGPVTVTIPSAAVLLKASVRSCTAVSLRIDRTVPIPDLPNLSGFEPIDAGPALQIVAPGIEQVMQKAGGFYTAIGLASFLAPGPYTLDNASGGVDIGPFTATLYNPTPVTWDNMAQSRTVDRSVGVTLRWSGGDPDGVLVISGTSILIQENNVTSGASFSCYARVSAGQFTVPGFITQQLPASNPQFASLGGEIRLCATVADLAKIPGVDVTFYNSLQSVGATVVFQ